MIMWDIESAACSFVDANACMADDLVNHEGTVIPSCILYRELSCRASCTHALGFRGWITTWLKSFHFVYMWPLNPGFLS
jgi:hypothetical protein